MKAETCHVQCRTASARRVALQWCKHYAVAFNPVTVFSMRYNFHSVSILLKTPNVREFGNIEYLAQSNVWPRTKHCMASHKAMYGWIFPLDPIVKQVILIASSGLKDGIEAVESDITEDASSSKPGWLTVAKPCRGNSFV